MRLAVVGSRDGVPQGLVCTKLDSLLRRMTAAGKGGELVIVSGGARGVDTFAESWARRNKVPVDIYLPDWQTYGKRAGFLRNQDIVNNCDQCVAFTTGSNGTADTIAKVRAAGKVCTVYSV